MSDLIHASLDPWSSWLMADRNTGSSGVHYKYLPGFRGLPEDLKEIVVVPVLKKLTLDPMDTSNYHQFQTCNFWERKLRER